MRIMSNVYTHYLNRIIESDYSCEIGSVQFINSMKSLHEYLVIQKRPHYYEIFTVHNVIVNVKGRLPLSLGTEKKPIRSKDSCR